MLSSLYRPCLTVICVFAAVCVLASASYGASVGFSYPQRVGFQAGDQWEPAIAADASGHVYVLYPQYGGVPGCPGCFEPTMTLVVSENGGSSWQAPRAIIPPISGQFDPQIMVDPADHRTVYAAWLQNKKSDVVVAKSVDFGQSWSVVVANRAADTDKPTLTVRGADVYVAFNHDHRLWVSASHDGGVTFLSSKVPTPGKPDWSLPSGATIDQAGNVYFSWASYTHKANRSRVSLYISRSADGARNWTTTLLDLSTEAPDCSAYKCGWAYLGAQITIASDAAGTLYALWNSGTVDKSPERIYFSSSTTSGATWLPKVDLSSAPGGTEHAFPTLVAGAAGDVRVAWMDTREHPLWNAFYRSSTNGGATWSRVILLSGGEPGYSYIKPNGFSFPFGDYFSMALDGRGQAHIVWGEGLNFNSPGSIWYSNGR
ncbi:MAG TPA: sialidase family protein [Terriglobales bacterium]|nr:sialidase family protein [Terriglobales bacterium]